MTVKIKIDIDKHFGDYVDIPLPDCADVGDLLIVIIHVVSTPEINHDIFTKVSQSEYKRMVDGTETNFRFSWFGEYNFNCTLFVVGGE
jgi:hypothetical protein